MAARWISFGAAIELPSAVAQHRRGGGGLRSDALVHVHAGAFRGDRQQDRRVGGDAARNASTMRRSHGGAQSAFRRACCRRSSGIASWFVSLRVGLDCRGVSGVVAARVPVVETAV